MADTIFAQASGHGRAGVAVIRLSGPRAHDALAALIGDRLPPTRRAGLRALYDPDSGDLLDRGLVLRFDGPRSYTGEASGELHVHGGPAVIGAVLAALGRQGGLRPAEPGEFTRRAVMAGKMDLTAAEGVADLVEAETQAQRHQAQRQLNGALGQVYDDWAKRLTRALAYAETAIDFSDDEDLGADPEAGLSGEIAAVRAEMGGHLAEGWRGERLRSGIEVALVGPVNAGKSSLLNALARRDAAIVTDQAGTTRDVVEVRLDLGGYPVTVADTAGLRAADGAVEAEGVRRARERVAGSDLVVAAVACDAPDAPGAKEALGGAGVVAATKTDRAAMPADLAEAGAYGLCLVDGSGLADFLAALETAVAERFAAAAAAPLLTRERHRAALQRAWEALSRYESAALPELAAEEIRLAVRALGEVTGKVDVEGLLDIIFRDFCVGK